MTASDASPTVRARVQGAARRQPVGMVVLGAFLYSLGPVLIRASTLSGTAFSFWRLVTAIPMLLAPLPIYLRMGGSRPDSRGWRWALWGGLLFGTHQVMFMIALQATSVNDVTLLGTLAPIATAALAIPLFGERPGAGFRLWTLVAIAGTAIVVFGASSGPNGDPLGMALAGSSVVLLSLFFLISKLSRNEIEVLPFLLGATTVGAVAVAGLAVVTGESLAISGTRNIVLVVIVAAIPGSLGHLATTWPLRWVPANVPPLLHLGIPVVSGVLAWLFLGEGITLTHVLGGALTLGGVAGAMLSPRGRRFSRGLDYGDEDTPGGRRAAEPSAAP